MKGLKEQMTEIVKNIMPASGVREFQIRFWIFSAIIGLFTFPIIHADVLFCDDHTRASHAWVFLGRSGRSLAELFFYIFNVSGQISDMGPFFQIASIFVLAAPIALLSLILKYNRLSAILALAFIVCTPFFLQNLSYRYDSITMAFSVALAILAVCAQLKQKYLYTVLCVLGLLGFYQASLSAFLVLSCLPALWCLFEKGIRDSVLYLVGSYLCALLALILYKIQLFLFTFWPGPAFKIGGYADEHNAVNYHLSHILQNIIGGLKYFCVDFNHGSVPLVLTACAIISLVFLFTKLFKASTRQNKPQKILFILWGLTLVLLGVVSIIGPMAILDNMLLAPRVMIGVGGFLALCVSFFLGKQASWSGWKRLPVALAAFMLIQVLFGAFIYGTVLSEESEFDAEITKQMVADTYGIMGTKPVFIRYAYHVDMAHLNHMDREALSFAPKTKTARRIQPWINEVLEIQYNMFFDYSSPEFWMENGAIDSMNVVRNNRITPEFSAEEAQRMVKTCDYAQRIMAPFYSLYQKGDKIVIDFASHCSKGGTEFRKEKSL